MRANWEIVLNALQQSPGDRVIEIGGWKFGWHDGKLCHILLKWKAGSNIFEDDPDEEVWGVSDISLNTFIKMCDEMSEEEIVGVAANTALTSMIRRGRVL